MRLELTRLVALTVCTTFYGGCSESHLMRDGGVAAVDGAPDSSLVQCVSDRECSGAGRVCDVARGVCAECARNEDCDRDAICILGACETPVPCASSRMCPGLVCDPSLGHCVECAADVDCEAPLVCEASRCRRARVCMSDEECPGRRCEPASGVCVECLADVDCAAPLVCDTTGSCVEPGTCACVLDADCDDGSFCNGLETCGGCEAGCGVGVPPCSADRCDEARDECRTGPCERTTPFFRDRDGDDFGDIADRVDACVAPAGYTRRGGDCDDGDDSRYPDATELCDGTVDQDCDGGVDEGCACAGGATRSCGSGVGVCLRATQSCTASGWSSCPSPSPRPESCNGLDDDCDGATDEAPEVDGACGEGTCVAGTCTARRPVALALTHRASFALMSDGTLRGWGDEPVLGTSPTPAPFGDVTGAIAMAADRDLVCAVLNDGRIACRGVCSRTPWGDDCSMSSSAFRIGPLVTDAIDIDLGGSHGCYLAASGRVRCWGANQFGQCGDGTTTERPRPVEVLGIDDAIDIAVSTNGACALRASGRVECWGFGANGELGHGERLEFSAVPVAVSGLDDAEAIARSDSHVCARRRSGAVACWGNGDAGALGEASMADRSAPVVVAGLPAAAVLPGTLAGQTTCVVATDASVSCVGYGDLGGLGDGSGRSSSTPVRVRTLDAVVSLEGGNAHWCAIQAGGEVWCWGANDGGQLGDGTTTQREAPVRMLDLP